MFFKGLRQAHLGVDLQSKILRYCRVWGYQNEEIRVFRASRNDRAFDQIAVLVVASNRFLFEVYHAVMWDNKQILITLKVVTKDGMHYLGAHEKGMCNNIVTQFDFNSCDP